MLEKQAENFVFMQKEREGFMRFACNASPPRKVAGKFFREQHSRSSVSGNYFFFTSALNLNLIFSGFRPVHTKVELSKIGLYYTRALLAKQNSGFSLN
ncbi:hypothetical protein [Paraburkholderia sp.]|uniref:hypothetical protein n=1 Tax=Paraburkholderia sp. TaxID=1926495 RepID=UPI003D6EBCB9